MSASENRRTYQPRSYSLHVVEKHCIGKTTGELKSHSSKWIKTKDSSLKKFYWQDGYGAFSVNPAEVNMVTAYIENQHEHHRKITNEEEYLAFLVKYGIEYDERYVWD